MHEMMEKTALKIWKTVKEVLMEKGEFKGANRTLLLNPARMTDCPSKRA